MSIKLLVAGLLILFLVQTSSATIIVNNSSTNGYVNNITMNGARWTAYNNGSLAMNLNSTYLTNLTCYYSLDESGTAIIQGINGTSNGYPVSSCQAAWNSGTMLNVNSTIGSIGNSTTFNGSDYISFPTLILTDNFAVSYLSKINHGALNAMTFGGSTASQGYIWELDTIRNRVANDGGAKVADIIYQVSQDPTWKRMSSIVISGNVSVYKNNIYAASSVQTSPFTITASRIAGTFAPNYYFNGSIDELAVWNGTIQGTNITFNTQITPTISNVTASAGNVLKRIAVNFSNNGTSTNITIYARQTGTSTWNLIRTNISSGTSYNIPLTTQYNTMDFKVEVNDNGTNTPIITDLAFEETGIPMIEGISSLYSTSNSSILITPSCSGFDVEPIYSVTNGSLFFDATTHIFNFTPIFEDGGTIKNLNFSCSYNGTVVYNTTKLIIYRDWSNLIDYPGNPVLPKGTSIYNSGGSSTPYINNAQYLNGVYYGYPDSATGSWKNFVLWTSTDLKNWTVHPTYPLALTTNTTTGWDNGSILHSSIIKHNSTTWYMYYSASTLNASIGWGNLSGIGAIGLATSTDLVNWTKYSNNPIYYGNPSSSNLSYTPSVIQIGDTLYMYYWNASLGGTDGAEYATSPSSDGINWTYGGIVLSRNVGDWDYSYTTVAFDNFVIQNTNGFYEMSYIIDGAPVPVQRMGYAISEDGINWYKYQGRIIFDGDVYVGNGNLYQYENYMYLYYNHVVAGNYNGSLAWIQSTTTGLYKEVSNTIYSDSAITYNLSPNGYNTLNISVVPLSDSVIMNITTWNTTGDYYKKFNSSGGNFTITAGGNPRNGKMQIKLNGTNYATVQANSTGYFRWVYSGGAGESQLEFSVMRGETNYPLVAVEVTLGTAAAIALYTIYRRRGRGGRIYGFMPFL